MTFEFSNCFYFAYINKIGGVESFFNYLCQNLQEYDITILYKEADESQLNRLRKYARVVKFKPGMKIKCKKLFLNYNTEIIDYIDADEYIQILHAAYKSAGVAPHTHPRINKYIGVSQLVCDEFTELTGLPAEVVYNPLKIDIPKRMLHLISATRLTPDKGKSRIEHMAELLDDAGIPYTWTIYTNDTDAINNENIIWRKPSLDIIKYIADADYLVQLSDSEGYGYSIVESLMVGTPVIVTDMPVMHEIGVKHGKNGFILKHDLSNFDANKIYNSNLKFTYEPKDSTWIKYINTDKKNLNTTKYLVKATSAYKKKNIIDSELGYIPNPGTEFIVSEERLFILLGANKTSVPFVEIVQRINTAD